VVTGEIYYVEATSLLWENEKCDSSKIEKIRNI
jgi:hypothetical protein